MVLNDDEFFTLVFRGNLRAFNGNPFKTETPFGLPFACATGNALEADGEVATQAELDDLFYGRARSSTG